VIYSQREQLEASLEQSLHVKYVSFEDLLAQSDWLVVQLPSGPATHHLLDAKAFGRMKKGLRLINVSRAQCMERDAVLAALRDGTLGGFALDTLWQEPGDDDDELLSFPNVILTPHTAGSPRQNGLLDFEQMVHQMDAAISPPFK
jgi:phosphoglycerate dehydrogenase-like enzyme